MGPCLVFPPTSLQILLLITITMFFHFKNCQNTVIASNFNQETQNFLQCEDIHKHFTHKNAMEGGFVKEMELGEIGDKSVVLSRPRTLLVREDFLHGMEMLLAFVNSSFTVELIGFCREKGHETIVTKYYKNGKASNLDSLFQTIRLSPEEELRIRLQLSEDYISIISYLHNSPVGTRVMCDSNDLIKTLSQYLISDDFHLLLADVDALPVVTPEGPGIKCGHRELFGSFVAPEQLWPWPSLKYNDSKMPQYNEKIDIWKIPDVLSYFLGPHSIGVQLKLSLFEVFQHCKSIDPFKRPTADAVLKDFKNVKKKFDSNSAIHGEL